MRYFILLTLITFCSCRTYIPAGVHTVETVIYHDTTVVVEADSALLTALLECDSAGNVMLKEIDRMNGRRVGLDLVLDKGRLTIRGIAPPVPIKVQIPERLIVTTKDNVIYKSRWYDIVCRWIAVFFGFFIFYKFRF